MLDLTPPSCPNFTYSCGKIWNVNQTPPPYWANLLKTFLRYPLVNITYVAGFCEKKYKKSQRVTQEFIKSPNCYRKINIHLKKFPLLVLTFSSMWCMWGRSRWSLNLTTGVENNETLITIKIVQLNLKNNCVDIEDEAVEISQVSEVDDVDQLGFIIAQPELKKTQHTFQINTSR